MTISLYNGHDLHLLLKSSEVCYAMQCDEGKHCNTLFGYGLIHSSLTNFIQLHLLQPYRTISGVMVIISRNKIIEDIFEICYSEHYRKLIKHNNARSLYVISRLIYRVVSLLFVNIF